jgi:hypothetical protein
MQVERKGNMKGGKVFLAIYGEGKTLRGGTDSVTKSTAWFHTGEA